MFPCTPSSPPLAQIGLRIGNCLSQTVTYSKPIWTRHALSASDEAIGRGHLEELFRVGSRQVGELERIGAQEHPFGDNAKENFVAFCLSRQRMKLKKGGRLRE